MIATLVNAAAVLVGSLLGLLVRGRLPERYRGAIHIGAGILTLVVGMKMALQSSQIVFLALSLIVGGILGEWWRIEEAILGVGGALERTFLHGRGREGARPAGSEFAYGFLNASLLFCVGAMTIVGAFRAGTEANYELILTKSVLDGFMAIVLAAAQGIGVAFSALTILVYQGGLTLLARLVRPLVNDALLAEITGIGGALVLMIGVNLLGLAKLKTANFLPAIVVMVLLVSLGGLLA